MTKYILIGDSGHAKVIEDCIVANGNCVVAKLDDKYNTKFQEGPYLKGPISMVEELLSEETKVIISIGHNLIRSQIEERLALSEDWYGIIKHPSAVISPSSSIGVGTVIMPNVVINANSMIGQHVILNTSSIIEHDCNINDFVHISPGAVLTGGVEVGTGTQIGAKTSVNPQVEIGKWSVVGAGSAVIRNIPEMVTVAGVPTTVIKKEGVIK